MTDTSSFSKVWVRTSILDKSASGDSSDSSAASTPTPTPPSSWRSRTSARSTGTARKGGKSGVVKGGRDEPWGWARAALLSGSLDAQSQTVVKVIVEDAESKHNGQTVEIPPESMMPKKNSKSSWSPLIVMANPDEDEENPPEDLIHLTHLHEPAVVHALRHRYKENEIYTATGETILLALNPFKDCGASLYDDRVMGRYWARGEEEERVKDAKPGAVVEQAPPLPPHVYGSADGAFRSMMRNLKRRDFSMAGLGIVGMEDETQSKPAIIVDQSLLVSGESGAGKTVSTKHIMRYLATLSQRRAMSKNKKPGLGFSSSGESARTASTSSTVSDGKRLSMPRMGSRRKISREHSWQLGAKIEVKVLESNPILEAFGNARTIRNDNSSRFGKFIDLQFKSTGSLIGAEIETYLLEKVRLIHTEPGERNFHIFYELLAGATDDERATYFLGDYTANDFLMTNSSGTFDRRDGVDDQEMFDGLLASMRTMGFSPEHINNILAVTIACLHARNLTFIAPSADESKVDDANPHLEAVLSLLGFEADAFNAALCSYALMAGKEKYIRSLPKAKAEKGLEALIKATYGALFSHLVDQINKNITYKPPEGGMPPLPGTGKAASIGVLDIFGFETFKKNSFEQLCINYCNEALQQQFNQVVFKTEKEEYEREGILIAGCFEEFADNQDVLDLIGKRGFGILPILDDICKTVGLTDTNFANDMYNRFRSSPHPRFEADFLHVGKQHFVVHHYAGPVEYDTDGIVEKNKDEIPRESAELLESSSNPFVKKLAAIISSSTADAMKTNGSGRAGRSSKNKSTGSQFSAQLRALRARIDLTFPHYIRCLKPNEHLRADDFNTSMIADQLRCLGVLEAIRLSRSGYPQRFSHKLFLQRYRTLAWNELSKASGNDERSLCEVLLQAPQIRDATQPNRGPLAHDGAEIQPGKTKVFLRQSAFDVLERLRNGKMDAAAIRIQAIGRMYAVQQVQKRRRLSSAAVKIQSCIRRYFAILELEFLLEDNAATIIESFFRFAVARMRFVERLNETRARAAAEKAAREEAERQAREKAEKAARVKAEKMAREEAERSALKADREKASRAAAEEAAQTKAKDSPLTDSKVGETERKVKKTNIADAYKAALARQDISKKYTEKAAEKDDAIKEEKTPSPPAVVASPGPDGGESAEKGTEEVLQQMEQMEIAESKAPDAVEPVQEAMIMEKPENMNGAVIEKAERVIHEEAERAARLASAREQLKQEQESAPHQIPPVPMESVQVKEPEAGRKMAEFMERHYSSSTAGSDETPSVTSRRIRMKSSRMTSSRMKSRVFGVRKPKEAADDQMKPVVENDDALEKRKNRRWRILKKRAGRDAAKDERPVEVNQTADQTPLPSLSETSEQELSEEDRKKQEELTETLRLAAALPATGSGVYDVVLPITSGGLMLNITEVQGAAAFASYRSFPDGSKGPAQLANLIHGVGDKIIAVNGEDCNKKEFKQTVTLLIGATRASYCHIRFQEWKHAYQPVEEPSKSSRNVTDVLSSLY